MPEPVAPSGDQEFVVKTDAATGGLDAAAGFGEGDVADRTGELAEYAAVDTGHGRTSDWVC